MDDPAGNSYLLAVLILAAASFVVLSMLFSASESAFLSLNKLRVHFLRKNGDKNAERVGKLLDRKEELLNMLLVGNEIVNVALSVVLTSVFLGLFGTKGLGIATSISTILLLIFGEITPKSVTTRHPEQISFALSRFASFFFWLLRPLVIFFTFVSRSILKIFGIDTREKKATFTEDEIKTLIDVGGEEGVLEKDEKKMMSRVFKFTDLAAVEIMVPRRNVIAITKETSFRDIIMLSERRRLSRFPVFEGDLDKIVGVLYVKDLLFYTGEREDFRVENIMRKPLFIPGKAKMSKVQELMHKKKQNFAIVVDEYSGTDGILTSEDIAREIFGGIAGDFSSSGRATALEQTDFSSGEIEIDGSTRLSDLEEKIRVPLESSMNETIAGFILEKLDRMAILGDRIEIGGFSFEVSKMDGFRISRVKCSQNKSDFDEDEDNAAYAD